MPKWVDDCVKKYTDGGLSKKEAWKRCMGAYNKRKKKKDKNKK
jgi:hypothetical protein